MFCHQLSQFLSIQISNHWEQNLIGPAGVKCPTLFPSAVVRVSRGTAQSSAPGVDGGLFSKRTMNEVMIITSTTRLPYKSQGSFSNLPMILVAVIFSIPHPLIFEQ